MVQLIVIVLIRRFLRKIVSQSFGRPLGRSDWSFLNQSTTFGDKLSEWYSKIIDIFHETCIRKATKQQKDTKPRKPWITLSLIKSIEKIHALYRKSIVSNNDLDQDIYKKYNITLSKLLRKVKRDYFTKQFEEANGSSTKT